MISPLRWKNAHQIVGLDFKPEKKDYKRVVNIRQEKRLVRLERREPKEEVITIPPIHISFPNAAYMAHSKDTMSLPKAWLLWASTH
jgi:hypothetical protein